MGGVYAVVCMSHGNVGQGMNDVRISHSCPAPCQTGRLAGWVLFFSDKCHVLPTAKPCFFSPSLTAVFSGWE